MFTFKLKCLLLLEERKPPESKLSLKEVFQKVENSFSESSNLLADLDQITASVLKAP